MINGIGSGANYPQQPGNAQLRERSDAARTPAATPDQSSEEVRQDLAAPAVNAAQGPADDRGELGTRRVEARRAAEDVQLERFRADELPLNASQALNTFADVASQREGRDVELAGIDIRV